MSVLSCRPHRRFGRSVGRALLVLAFVATLLVSAAPPATAEGDGLWDYRLVGVNGTYQPIRGFFDFDEIMDILWYAPGTAPDSIWFGTAGGGGEFLRSSIRIDGRYTPITGDFGADGFTDILWYAPGTAPDSIWFGGDTGSFTRRSVTVNGVFSPIVLRDLRPDGKDEIFWYAPGSAPDVLWRFAEDGTGGHTSMSEQVNGLFRPIIGRWDSDQLEDIVWYGPGSAPDALWLTNSGGPFSRRPLAVNGTYDPVTINGSGETDGIYWYAPGPATDAMWRANVGFEGGFTSRHPGQVSAYCDSVEGDVIIPAILYCPDGRELRVDDLDTTENVFDASVSLNVPSGFIPIFGGFDGDGRLDLFWYGPGSEIDQIWYSVDPDA